MFSENLRYLRKQKGLSQQALADVFEISRSGLSGWEQGYTEPSIEALIEIARYFDVSVDQLLNDDLSRNNREIFRSDAMRVLAISVDTQNNQQIELVSQAAEAGYLESYADPEFIAELPKIQFPQLDYGTFRAFEIQGQSMLPVEPGSIIIGQYVENLSELKDQRTYIIATKDPSLVYKRVINQADQQRIIAMSDNPEYEPFTIDYQNIREIWAFHAYVGFSDDRRSMNEEIDTKLDRILCDIQALKSAMDH